MVIGNVYKYWTDEDGVITKMQSMIQINDEKGPSNDGFKAATYSYNQDLDRLTLADADTNLPSRTASLEEAKVIFAVKPAEGVADAGYIRTADPDTTHQGMWVDSDDVIAVKAADIPDLESTHTKNEALVDKNTTWLESKENADNDEYTIALSKNSSNEASAVVMGVTDFSEFNFGSVKVGLLTDLGVTGSSKNRVVDIDVAVNGEVTNLTSESGKEVSDIVYNYNDVTKKETSVDNAKAVDELLKDNGGAYAEITTNSDGKVTKVVIMGKENGNNNNKLVGWNYAVVREVVDQVKTKNFSTVANDAVNSYVAFSGEKNLYSVSRITDTAYKMDDDIKYYTIDGRPTIAGKKGNSQYDNQLMQITNMFKDTPKVTAESDSSLTASYIDDKFNDADTYYVADVAYKKTQANDDRTAVAVFAYEDSLGETASDNKYILALNHNDVTAPATVEVTATKIVSGNAYAVDRFEVVNKDGKAVDGITVGNVNGTYKADITIARNTAAGTYTVNAIDDQNKIVGSVSLSVKAGDAAVTNGVAIEAPLVDATTFNVTVEDQDGNGITGLTAADFSVTVAGVILNNDSATNEQFTVSELGNGKYQIQDRRTGANLEGKTVSVTVAGKTATLENASAADADFTVAAPADYTLDPDGSDVTAAVSGLKNVAADDIVLKNAVAYASYDAAAKELTFDADELNKLDAGDYTVTLKAGTVEKTATITVKEQEIEITAVALNSTDKKIVLTLDAAAVASVDLTDADLYADILAQAVWTNATANLETSSIDVNGTTVTLNLKDLNSASAAAGNALSMDVTSGNVKLTCTETPTFA